MSSETVTIPKKTLQEIISGLKDVGTKLERLAHE